MSIMKTTFSTAEVIASRRAGIDNRETRNFKQSSIDNRVSIVHKKLCEMLNDEHYEEGHTHKLVKAGLSDADIYGVADYCQRKATQHMGRAFVVICEKKLRQRMARS